jgi:hypothetical protein
MAKQTKSIDYAKLSNKQKQQIAKEVNAKLARLGIKTK